MRVRNRLITRLRWEAASSAACPFKDLLLVGEVLSTSDTQRMIRTTEHMDNTPASTDHVAPSLYSLLELTPLATTAEVRAAYLRLVRHFSRFLLAVFKKKLTLPLGMISTGEAAPSGSTAGGGESGGREEISSPRAGLHDAQRW